jgi:uncharacterized integral membrane protein
MTDPRPERKGTSESPLRWIVPALLGAVVVTPVLIFIASNTGSTPVAWAGLEWEAPLWIVLGVTFLAGMLSAPLFAWGWRRWRKRRRRLADERDVLRQHG